MFINDGRTIIPKNAHTSIVLRSPLSSLFLMVKNVEEEILSSSDRVST